MNILYVSPSNAIGGAETSLLVMIRHFKQRGHGVFVALPASTDQSFEALLLPHVDGVLYVKTMRWHAASASTGLLQKLIQYLYASYKSGGWHVAPIVAMYRFIVKNNIDVVHTNTMFSIDGAIAAKCAGVPHVQHVRELIGAGSHSLARFSLMNQPAVFRKCMTVLHARVVANSKATGEACGQYFARERLVQIYNPLPDDMFVRLEPEAGSSRGPITVALVANLTARFKNHALFLEIAREFRERYASRRVRFHIYGTVPAENDPTLVSLRNTIRSYGLEDDLTLMGHHADPRVMFGEIDILVHTYPGESFGRIFVEAMSQGVPVVAADGGGASELIQHGRTGFLVRADSPAVFAERIEWLLAHPVERQAIVDNAYAFALEFKAGNIMPRIESLYREVASDRRKTARTQ